MTADDRRFIALREGESAQGSELVVAMHWLDALKGKTGRYPEPAPDGLYLTSAPEFSTFAGSAKPNRHPTSEVRVPHQVDAPPRAGLTKALSLLIIALMLGAIIYATAIAIRNWSHIGV